MALTWGLVTTIKAELPEILGFAAHHLDLGVHRLYIYLDDPERETFVALKAHPKIRVTACDREYWAKTNGFRPVKHQVRQTANATHAYHRRAEVDWLGHIDGDEFLWPTPSMTAALAALPAATQTARMRPVEALAPDTSAPQSATFFKGLPVERAKRDQATLALYPDYAAHIDDGFLSHVAGKVFLRTGLSDVTLKIHNAVVGGQTNPGEVELDGVRLLHMHAESWEDWRAHFTYRHTKGAYRADLGRKGPSGMTMHDFFASLIETGGDMALRRFYDKVCRATPEHCARLDALGLLHRYELALTAKIQRHFPQNH